jgi:D-arabinose 1-dehydrogenase-like Zn-dependent alcohol dehydrogenase
MVNSLKLGRQDSKAIPIKPHIETYALYNANLALQDLKADRINGTGVLIL